MRSLDLRAIHFPVGYLTRLFIASVIGLCLALLGSPGRSQAQTNTRPSDTAGFGPSSSSLLPPDHDEIADEDIRTWTTQKLAPQQYMREFYWRSAPDTPAFFRDSLMQIVARTYYLNRENSSGTTS